MKTIITILSLVAFALSAQARTFTDKDGKVIDALIISKTNDSVVLKMQNNQKFEVKIDRFSDADIGYIQKWVPFVFTVEIRKNGKSSESLKSGSPYTFTVSGGSVNLAGFSSGDKSSILSGLKRFVEVSKRYANEKLPESFKAELKVSGLDEKSLWRIKAYRGKLILRHSNWIILDEFGVNSETAEYLIEYLSGFNFDEEIRKYESLERKSK